MQKAHLPVRVRKLTQLMDAVEGREGKFGEIRAYLSPWCSVCTKAMFIPKGRQAYGDLENVSLSSVQKAHLPVQVRKLPHLM